MEAALFVVANSARLLQFDMIFEFYRTMRTKRGGKNKTLPLPKNYKLLPKN